VAKTENCFGSYFVYDSDNAIFSVDINLIKGNATIKVSCIRHNNFKDTELEKNFPNRK